MMFPFMRKSKKDPKPKAKKVPIKTDPEPSNKTGKDIQYVVGDGIVTDKFTIAIQEKVNQRVLT